MFRDIDPAFLRRFERKILIELPDAKDRLEMFKSNLPEIETWDDYCLNQIADSTGYFTGDEIRIACKEASMMLIRENIQRCKGKNCFLTTYILNFFFSIKKNVRMNFCFGIILFCYFFNSIIFLF